MLVYKNINGETEAVSERVIVRFSRKEDLSSNCLKPITYIHLSSGEHLKTHEKIDSLIKQFDKNQNG